MKKLLIYLKGYALQSVLSPLFKLLEASFELIVPLVIASIIDVGIANGDAAYVTKRAGVLVLLALIGMAASITAQYFAAAAATGFGKGLRRALYGKIQSLSFSELDTVGTSTLITRMTNDVNQVQNSVNLVLRLFLRSPFIVLGAMVMAFTIDIKCALIFAVAIIALSVVVFGIMGLTIPGYRGVQGRLDGITQIIRENLTGARVIRAFTGEENETQEFSKRNKALSVLQKSVGRISALLNPVTYVIINAAVIALIYIGAVKVNAGDLTQGQVVALYNYMSQILVELIKLANLIVTVTRAFASADRLRDVLELESSLEYNDNPAKSDSFIEYSNVSLRYNDSSADSIENISFTAQKGEVIGIIGGTGSGKSSLVSLLPHFYDTTGGTVFVDGRDVKSMNPEELREKIGFVHQKAVLFKGSVRDNMKWGRANADDNEIIEALKAAQIYETIEQKGGLDFFIEQNGSNLSGGQKQRLSIARALVRKPEILVLDDSSSALDFATEARLRDEIYALPYKPTVFIVSQRASSVMGADKILVMDDGRCAAIGSHKQLMKSCENYREIYNSQFAEEAPV